MPPPLLPLTPIERRAFDYTALEEAMAHLDAVVRQRRRTLSAPTSGRDPTDAGPAPGGLEEDAIID